MTAGVLDPLPARSNGLDNVDGGPDAGFYIQIGIIKQVSIRGRFQRRNCTIAVAFVAFEDVLQHGPLIRRLATGAGLQRAALGTDVISTCFTLGAGPA